MSQSSRRRGLAIGVVVAMVLSCDLWLEQQPNDGNSRDLASYGGKNSCWEV